MQFVDLKAQYSRIEEQVNQRMRKVLDHGQYIMGPEVRELEVVLADYVGVKHCIGVASGTDALLVALMALGVGHGDEVITTPFTFIATAETIALLGAKPIYVDIDPRTYNIDPTKIEASITPKTKAIMPVSLYGQCADMNAINAVALAHGLPVIEDGCQSMGATYQGRYSCSLSTIGCTSFFPSKPLGCYGDAGACFTDDDDLAKLMKEIRVHGQDRRYHHPRLGINGRLDTLQAAVLLAKMELFPQEVEARINIGGRYSELLSDVACGVPYIEKDNTSVYAQFTIEVDDRESFLEGMKQQGVPTAVHYPVPLHQQPAFLQEDVSVPQSEYAAGRVVSIPMHPYLTEGEISKVVEAIKVQLS